MRRRRRIADHIDQRATANRHHIGMPAERVAMNSLMNNLHIRKVVFSAFSPTDHQRRAHQADGRAMMMAIRLNGLQQIRMVLPDAQIDDTEQLFRQLATLDHIAYKTIFASKELVCEVYRIVIAHLYSLVKRLHSLDSIPLSPALLRQLNAPSLKKPELFFCCSQYLCCKIY